MDLRLRLREAGQDLPADTFGPVADGGAIDDLEQVPKTPFRPMSVVSRPGMGLAVLQDPDGNMIELIGPMRRGDE